MRPISKNILWVVIFSVSMAFLESAVVIYLRKLYYPDGFNFPLRPMDASIARVEFFREIATIMMLVGIGFVTGKTKLQRFAFFNLAFGIWDLFYYVFLYVFLAWPESLATWDILFLVPVPWVGPVWAPCILSLLMIIGSVFIALEVEKNRGFEIKKKYWTLLFSGAFICVLSFMWDYLQYARNKEVWSPFSTQSLFTEVSDYVPQSFHFILFFCGFSLMCYAVFTAMFVTIKNRK